MLRKILLTLILLCSVAAYPTTYFIAVGGSDAHGCLNATVDACLTPNRLNALLHAGDTAMIAAAVFNLPDIQAGAPWNVTVSGTPGNPITFTSTGGGGIITGFHIFTATGDWTEDTINSFSNCPDNASCKPWYRNVSGSTFQNVESIFYKTSLTSIQRRPRPTTNNKNAIPKNGDSITNVCGAGVVGGVCQATQGQANVACGCPSGGIGGHDCVAKTPPAVEPTPWYCGSIRFEYTQGDLTNTMHGENIGDVEIIPFEVWTIERMRLKSANSGTAILTGPTVLGNSGDQTGFIPGHNYLADNVMEQAGPGQWYLDRCPNNCPGNVPEATWRLYIFAGTGEDPNVDTVYVPQMAINTPQVLTVSNQHDLTFTGFSIEGDNFQVPALGFQDKQGIGNATAAVDFNAVNNVIWDSMQVFHCNGHCFWIESSNSSGWQVTNSSFYDCGAICAKFGEVASLADTDTSVIRNFTITNNIFAYNGRIEPTGEGTTMYWGNGHNATIWNNDVIGGYCGGMNVGHGLNVGINGGINAYFMYAIDVGFNNISGQRNLNTQIGLLTDCGGIYTAGNHSVNCGNNPTDWCVTLHDNVVHDFGSNFNITTNHGAAGLYCDQGCSWLHAYNNLVYRVAQECSQNNVPSHGTGNFEAQFVAQNNLWENNIFIGCGSAKYSNARLFNIGGSNVNAMTMKHNVFIYNSNHGETPQANPGKWGCFDYDPLSPTYTHPRPCTDMFTFDYNLYWDMAGKRPQFITCAVMDCSSFTNYSDVPWGGGVEDVHSITNQNVGVVNPKYSFDNFFLTNREALNKIGFVMFDYTKAGRNNPVLSVPIVPNPWPLLTSLDADADYLGTDIGPTPLVQFWSPNASTSKVK